MKKSSSNITILIERDERLQRIYTFHKKLSNGCFGYLFLVTNRITNKRNALKVQIITTEARLTLKKEFQILRKLEGVKGIPEVYNFGRTEKLVYLEIQLLARDLGSWDEKHNKISKVCAFGHDMIRILEQVHSKGIVHRDLKPQNMMLDKDDQLYLIDFGISKEIVKGETKGKVSFVGTPRYASINAHKGKQQTPVDDIESLMYNLIFLCNKTLPWISVGGNVTNKLQAILAVKAKISKSELCKGLPKCFLQIFDYISKLKHQQPIGYDYLAVQFKQFRQKQVKTQVSTSCPDPLSIPLTRSVKVTNNRRVSIESNNLLLVPYTITQVLSSSAQTIDIPESQQVMRSMESVSGEFLEGVMDMVEMGRMGRKQERKEESPERSVSSLNTEDLEERLCNQDTVESKIRKLKRNMCSFRLSD